MGSGRAKEGAYRHTQMHQRMHGYFVLYHIQLCAYLFSFFKKLVKICHVLGSVRGAVDANPNKTESLPPEVQEVDSRERNIMQHGEC